MIPNRLRKKGMNKIHTASHICEMEISRLGCCTAKVSVKSGMFLKLSKNGLA